MPDDPIERLRQRLMRIERAPQEEQWSGFIQEWVHDVGARLAEIKTWLKPLLEGDDPPLQWEDLQVAIGESDKEVYHALGARLIGPRGRFVEIVPKARQVFNATGRVDFVSRKGRVMLARFNPGKWSFVWPEGEEWRSADLSRLTLAEVLEEMLT